MLLICLSSISILYTTFKVEASSGGGSESDSYLDREYMWKIIEDLASVVNSSYKGDDIVKGRFFGSEGESDTADNLRLDLINNCSFDVSNVKEVPLKPLKSNANYYYTDLFDVESYSLTINHDYFLEDTGLKHRNIAENDTYPLVATRPKWDGGYDYTRSFDETRVLNLTDFMTTFPLWDKGINPLNVSYTLLNNMNITMGNVTYINESSEVPEYQEDGTVFLIDEVNGCDDKLADVIDTTGVILIKDEQKSSYETQTADSCNFPVARVNSDLNNLTSVIQMLENDTIVIADSTIYNDTITFVHNLSSSLCYPNYDFVIVYNNTKGLFFIIEHCISLQMRNIIRNWFGMKKCLGIIYYDGENEEVHNMPTQNKNNIRLGGGTAPMFALPGFSVNRTIGEFLRDRSGEPENNISGHLTQKYYKEDHTNWQPAVETYNVEAYLNTTKSPDDKIVVLSNRYDSMWGECPGDSGCGTGIIMGIAKYMKNMMDNYSIEPKYNVTFLFTTGEELGYRGAQYYSDSHPDDNIFLWIGTDQLGFKGENAHLLNLYKTKKHQKIGKKISEIVDYEGETNYPMEHNLSKDEWQKWSPRWKKMGAGVEDIVFIERGDCDTILVHKGGDWNYHHRRGHNLTEGDVLKNIDRNDVNVTYNLTWAIVKYFLYNPNCWFKDGSISYNLSDAQWDNNNYYDSVSINFTVNTSMPSDRVLAHAYLQCEDFPYNNLLFRYSTKKTYNITKYNGIQDTLTVSLKNRSPKGNYSIHLDIYNSTGEVNSLIYYGNFANDTFEADDVFFMHPPSDPVNTPCKPNGSTSVKTWWLNKYTSNATDPNDDNIFYKWRWESNYGTFYSPWINALDPYQSGENCSYYIGWVNPGEYKVQVRAKDNILNPNVMSNWSEPLDVSVTSIWNGTWVSFSQTIFGQMSSEVLIANEEVECQGVDTGYTTESQTIETYSWFWDFGDGTNSTEENPQHNYSSIGEYIVNLTVENSGGYQFNCTTTVDVLEVKAGFSPSSNGSQPGKKIYFNDTSSGVNSIVNWTWDFDDGNVSYSQSVNHAFINEGTFNVSLTVTDDQSNNHTHYQVIYVESMTPSIASVIHTSDSIVYGSNITIFTDFFDNQSGIEFVKVNISYPDGSTGNYSMNENSSVSFDYEYNFEDTCQIGLYNYTIWVFDEAGNVNSSPRIDFVVEPIFGCTTPGNSSQNIADRITGSNFTILVNATANNISAYLQANSTISPKAQCMIYRVNDSVLVGKTENRTLNTGSEAQWITFNLSDPKPTLVKNTEYVLATWSNDTCDLFYNNANYEQGMYANYTFGNAPDPINWNACESRTYSLYCSYLTVPEIINVSSSPDTVGFGSNVTISTDIEDNGCVIDQVKVNVTYQGNSTGNYTMNKTEGCTYEYLFNETWKVGQYNFSIWTIDELGGTCTSSGHSFNVSVQATIAVCTIKDAYGNNELINLTDPPGGSPLIGYELLDESDVLHIWNPDNSYYFDTDSGIQLTNHYDEYWSHNVLMLGYYNNDQWNLIYRTDELSGFSKNVTTDNETYVNATLWKDLSYQGYDFRLAIRYHLELNDSDLTVIPYIKNLGDAIPYNLGFGWEINDIKIADTYENDWIRLYNGTNWTRYQLDQALDNSYTDMDYNTTFVLEGVNESGFFRRSLYLKWNHTLDYCLRIKSRTGEYNAPVALFIKIGPLGVGQEKQTLLSWLDSDNWLGVDRWNYHSCSGYTGSECPEGALDGAGVWLHLCNENHWLVLDLEKSYNIKKIRGRSNMGGDPTSVDIYISNDLNNWGTAVTTGISTWQDTTSWAEVDITDTVGRFVNISITSTESGSGPNYLEFGGVPTPMTIFDVYGEALSNSTFYYNSYEDNIDWATNPGYMVDGSTSNYASTSLDNDLERCIGNTCDGSNYGKISQVELRVHGYHSNSQRNIILTPVFGGYNPGSDYSYPATTTPGWSNWFDITNDNSAPGTWTWNEIANLDCEVRAEQDMGAFTLYCSKVEIRVIYDPLPAISNPGPGDGSIGISITPTLNITVSDFYGDSMNISWLGNSSGSWQEFGANNSVSNGTYHQIFSNATENGKWWYWKVNVSDGDSYNESNVYKFYTGYQSKINNTGSTNFKGYLLMQVQFYNETSEEWEVADDTVNETSPRTLLWADPTGSENQNILALDTIFNCLVNTSTLSSYGNGTYRIYTAFRDPDGNVLVCDDETFLEATYEFTITFT